MERADKSAFCDYQVQVLLYKTAIKPTLVYGNEIWPLIQDKKTR